MSLASKLKSHNRIELLSSLFYFISGLILLVYLPLTNFPPQLGFLGILSVISAYSVYTKRVWAPYLVFILFAGATTFSLYTLYSIGFTNAAIAVLMIVYAVLTWIFAYYVLLKRR